jgi:hypothetical protein
MYKIKKKYGLLLLAFIISLSHGALTSSCFVAIYNHTNPLMYMCLCMNFWIKFFGFMARDVHQNIVLIKAIIKVLFVNYGLKCLIQSTPGC